MQKVIAIDGPSASGKSTLAARLAERLGIPYVNTGNMFRAVALLALRAGLPAEEAAIAPLVGSIKMRYCRDAAGAWQLEVNGEFPGPALRAPDVAQTASRVAALKCVRDRLCELQRGMAQNGWIVMEGRDIGTVIFPDAEYKFFVTASPLERARRRLAQSGEVADGATLEAVAAEIAKRDEQDSTRTIAPLKPAPDAILLDNSTMDKEASLQFLWERTPHARA